MPPNPHQKEKKEQRGKNRILLAKPYDIKTTYMQDRQDKVAELPWQVQINFRDRTPLVSHTCLARVKVAMRSPDYWVPKKSQVPETINHCD